MGCRKKRFAARGAVTSITHRRLVRKAAGVVTVLREDAGTYNVGQSYGLVVEAFSDHLAAYLDTVPSFGVLDGDLRAGRAGFYCWANRDARLARVQVFGGQRI